MNSFQAPDAARRIVITGMGVISPLGNQPEKVWEALRGGCSAVQRIRSLPEGVLPIRYGAEALEFTGSIDDYGPLDKSLQRTIRKGQKLMCREIEMGVAAAQLAISHAELTADRRDPHRTGVIFGSDYIMTLPEEFAEGIRRCMDASGAFDFSRWAEVGLPQVNPLWLLKYLPNMPASHVAIYNDLQGPNNSITLREASACAALSEAYSTLSRGHADALVVGSTGSRIHPFRTLHASLQEALAGDREDPAEMSRPFDADRDGAVLGEGAAALILETLDHARGRGATILGEVVGYGCSTVGPTAGGDFQRRALVNALRGALRGVEPGSVGSIHAHGVGTRPGDAQEARALEEVFGSADRSPPVVAAKSFFGNLGAGGGMVEVVISLLALQQGVLFPTLNYRTPDPECALRMVTDGETAAGESFISVNVTPQGQATAIRIAAPS
jgi:3-oxoacyl-[acyl-carrier-protein] synthase II